MLNRVSLLSLAVACAASSATFHLATSDTAISLEAGSRSPQLTQVGANWLNQIPETLIDNVEINSAIVKVKWHLASTQTKVSMNLARFVYESSNPPLRLLWEWRARNPHGPVEHSIRIQNLGKAELWLPLQDSFAFHFAVGAQQPIQQFFVEKGASSPSAEGVHLVTFKDGDQWTGTSSTYAHPSKGAPREIIPYLLVERANDQSGWYLGIEFSGRTRIALQRNSNSIIGNAGLNPEPGPYKTRLPPGVTYETPTVFLGSFKGGPDGAANSLRRWIREVLNNPVTLRNPIYPTLVSNSWGSGMAINETQAHGMIRDASDLGLEMFHLDAGWFREIGDWLPSPEKFPHGVAAVADYAHKMSLKFGLWTDWTQAGLLIANNPKMRDWLTADPPADWKPADFKGITMDIGLPQARSWASSLVMKLISDFHLDMLEHDGYLVAQGCDKQDHPHAPLDSATAHRYQDEEFLWVSGSNDTDVSDHATRAYYQVQSEVRSKFPALLLEICNDGGRMVDFGSAAHGDYFSISDGYDPLSNRRAFFDASYVLPPAMLETYVEKWPSANIANFRYMLRSGLMGWFSLMQDSASWTAEQHAAARREFAVYKQKLRPLIRNADLYHVSERPDGQRWDGMEYFDAASGRAVLFAFRGARQDDVSHTFKLQGLQQSHQYRITFQDHTAAEYIASGEQLRQSGLTVKSPTPNSSELVFLNDADIIGH